MVLSGIYLVILARVDLVVLATVQVRHGRHLRGLRHSGGLQVAVCHHGGAGGPGCGHRSHCEHWLLARRRHCGGA